MEQHSSKKLLLVVAVLIAVGIIAWLLGGRSTENTPAKSPEAGGREASAVDGTTPPDRQPTPQDAALIRGTITAVEKIDSAYRLTLALTGLGDERVGMAEVAMTAAQAYNSDSSDISSTSEWIAAHLKKRELAKQPPRKNDKIAVLATLESFQNTENTAGERTFTLDQAAEKRVIFLPLQ